MQALSQFLWLESLESIIDCLPLTVIRCDRSDGNAEQKCLSRLLFAVSGVLYKARYCTAYSFVYEIFCDYIIK
ncbi:MAG: hypothetical protein V7K47_14710 [Nostoc sp.]